MQKCNRRVQFLVSYPYKFRFWDYLKDLVVVLHDLSPIFETTQLAMCEYNIILHTLFLTIKHLVLKF